jgi:polysaccharide export outer membrane protein
MQYQPWIALLGSAISVSLIVIPTLAAPIVDAASHKLVDRVQPETVQRIHIAVIGEVRLPGAYFLDKADGNSTAQQQLPTVTQAIQMAGGITQNADIRQVQVRRRTSNSSQPTIINVNLYELLSKADVSQDISLQEGDAVVVMPIPE